MHVLYFTLVQWISVYKNCRRWWAFCCQPVMHCVLLDCILLSWCMGWWWLSRTCVNNEQSPASLEEDSFHEAVQSDHITQLTNLIPQHAPPPSPRRQPSVPVPSPDCQWAIFRLVTFCGCLLSQVRRAMCLPCIVTDVGDWQDPAMRK